MKYEIHGWLNIPMTTTVEAESVEEASGMAWDEFSEEAEDLGASVEIHEVIEEGN